MLRLETVDATLEQLRQSMLVVWAETAHHAHLHGVNLLTALVQHPRSLVRQPRGKDPTDLRIGSTLH